ncbi:hypothetical protein MtrunA17_Chr6g0480761 [Medicago truncatula]|uniref:Transmembrane protein n=1 Tax=Medicago truncatula TaxID=3880 RepID=A0A396HGT0_MEDTR|nr:hypothetical protein MtrunA17_Chr6g0480761 [Medicago truncatula]
MDCQTKFLSIFRAYYAKNFLSIIILGQYIAKLFRFLPRIIGQSPTQMVSSESTFGNFIAYLLSFMFFSHVVGSGWYLFALQRVHRCLQDACHHSNLHGCMELINCDSKTRMNISAIVWRIDKGAETCMNATSGAFSYGIYANAIPLTKETRWIKKYVYSLFWGFQVCILFVYCLSSVVIKILKNCLLRSKRLRQKGIVNKYHGNGY